MPNPPPSDPNPGLDICECGRVVGASFCPQCQTEETYARDAIRLVNQLQNLLPSEREAAREEVLRPRPPRQK